MTGLATDIRTGYLPRLADPWGLPWAVVTLRRSRHRRRGAKERMQRGEEQLHRSIEAHHKRLVGWFRARVFDRHTAEDLSQQTWIEVLRHGHTFDEAKASFWRFTLIWARLVLRRHWEAKGKAPVSLDTPRDEGGAGGESEIAAPAVALEDLLDAPEIFVDLLRQTLECQRLPHEIIAFGFVNLLEWKPQRVVAELSECSLEGAAEMLERDYCHEVPLAEVHAAFAPLRVKLGRTLADCEADKRAKEPHVHLFDRTAGSTRLADYYPADKRPEDAVTRWWSSVSRKAKEDLLRKSSGKVAEFLQERPWLAAETKGETPAAAGPTGQRKRNS